VTEPRISWQYLGMPRLLPISLVGFALAAALSVGCMGESTGLAGDASGGGGNPPSDPSVTSDMPCEAANVLIAYCTGCHGTPLSGGAPQALNSLAALQAPSPGYPSASNGARAVVRMASTASPMPPSPNPAVPAAEQTAFAAWVSAGMPNGTCSTPVDAGTVVQDPVFAAAPNCTSGRYWTSGNQGSSQMYPGQACIACHARGEGPTFAVAGTVYPSGHEYDDCFGSGAAGAVVMVTDKNGNSQSFTVNSAGNFSGNAGTGWPVFPITATVTFQGKTRAMSTAVPSGDCNSCHTQSGASNAPGRIALP
jgi:hypothetical protein